MGSRINSHYGKKKTEMEMKNFKLIYHIILLHECNVGILLFLILSLPFDVDLSFDLIFG